MKDQHDNLDLLIAELQVEFERGLLTPEEEEEYKNILQRLESVGYIYHEALQPTN